MPLPPPRKFLLTTIIMSDVPLLPNGFRPVITVSSRGLCLCLSDGVLTCVVCAGSQVHTAPRQHGDSKVVYNTVWDNPNPPLFAQGQGCIVFQV